MARLTFSIPALDFATRSSPALPVDVLRARDNAVVKRTVTGEDTHLAPGEYVAMVRLPDGSQSAQDFSLTETGGLVVLEEAARVIGPQVQLDEPAASEWRSDLSYRLLEFNPFSGTLEAGSIERNFELQARVVGDHSDRFRFLAVAPRRGGADVGVFLMAVPTPDNLPVAVNVSFDADGNPRPSFKMKRAASTFLYRYLSSGAVDQALRLSESEELSALDLVANKREDPVSGALGMYLLLNAGRGEELRDRSQKLFKYNATLGDGAIIWAEQLALQGEHERAVETLVDLKTRSIPALTAGFRVALSRISTYLRSEFRSEELVSIDKTLRYWAARALPDTPTTVVKLDAAWARKVRSALG